MKKLFLLFVLPLLIIGCKRDEDDPKLLIGYNIDSSLIVYVKDKDGKNLVGTDGFDKKSVKITYINPVPSSPTGTLDYPEHFLIGKDLNGEEFFKIFLNLGQNDSKTAETKIEWNNITDTFTSEIERSETSIFVVKVYMNGELVCPDAHKYGRTITLVK